jgi:ketosteroid isomerase-like protein
MSTRAAVENFVKVFNEAGSEIYPLYADRVNWIEMPSGRRGGREELFEALRQSRTHFGELRMEALSITAGETDAVLESELTLVPASGGDALTARTIWIFGFADGKIVREHDYSIVLPR